VTHKEAATLTSNVRAVLFDLDGVVVHPWGFRDELAREHGITPDMTAGFFKGPFLECLEGRVDLLDALAPFLTGWGWGGDASSFVDRWLAADDTPNDDVIAVVRAVRQGGLPCFAAAKQERVRARYLEREMGFATLFDGLFFSCDLGVMKPRPEFYTTVASRLALSPAELLFFDDTPENVAAARAAGWRAELFTSVDQLRADVRRHTNLRIDESTT
jgi:putative hydrolase of the HAD superfamily